MTEVIFHDDDNNAPAPVHPVAQAKETFLSKLIIRTGLVKTVAEAEQVLLILAIIMLLVTVGIVVFGNNSLGRPSVAEIKAANAVLEAEQQEAQQQNQAASSSQ